MRIAIVTIQSVNYGNRLQNYALQHVLEGYGHEVCSLRREPFGMFQKAKRCLRNVLKTDRNTAFYRFDDEYVNLSEDVLSKDGTTSGLDARYDLFVIGSDQVWNPSFSFNSELDYLPMVSSGKKIAYAASFGVSEIGGPCARTADLLRGISAMSVREAAGAKIVHDLIERDVPVVLDPTMLLTVGDWARIAKKPDCAQCGEPFALKYVLGADAAARSIQGLADERDLDVVDVMDESLKIGPAEFVWLAANCSLVCTDSFHASVFALLHHKPLAIFERVSDDADMSSRFDTLCDLFEFNGHRGGEGSFGTEAVYGMNWDSFELRLADLRAFSRGWLERVLEGAGARG